MMSNKPYQQVGISHRSRKMDSLSMDVRDAREAGMSYGMWKALHPDTKRANEAKTARQCAQEDKPVDGQNKKSLQIFTVTCQCCGTVFETTNKQKKYCRPGCNRIKQQAKYRERRKNHHSHSDTNESEL